MFYLQFTRNFREQDIPSVWALLKQTGLSKATIEIKAGNLAARLHLTDLRRTKKKEGQSEE